MLKKVLFTAIILLATVSAKAQFVLTPDGLINSKSPDNNYVTYEFKDKSQQELFDAAMSYLFSLYVNPDAVLSSSKPHSITINAISTNAAQIQKRLFADIAYTISIQIKDHKIRINTPYIVSITHGSSKYFIKGYTMFGNCVYSNKGKLINELAKQSIELFFNNYIADLYKGITNNINGDNW